MPAPRCHNAPVSSPPCDYDVLILGAGLSGVCAAYYLKHRCPNHRFAILEARADLGGTWDLFRYPGIRSDSDMYTLGYSFRPWTKPNPIGEGADIREYIRDTAVAFGLDRHIQLGQRVVAAAFSSAAGAWTLTVRDAGTGATREVTCRFLFACLGYYDYEAGYEPAFPGRERFGGEVVHPQKWTEDIAYEGKKVVVIGSGATAITLVPALARRAAHVVMLQRSPSYVFSRPSRDRLGEWLDGRLSPGAAAAAKRWSSVAINMAFYQFCRRRPERARRWLLGQVKRHLGDAVSVEPHFAPTYQPWDQRLCLVPDADLFQALREGRASVVTDSIETFTETGIRLASGRELAADLIVTATGLSLSFLGGIEVSVDGEPLCPSERCVYKGTMLTDVPNLAFASGYTNASWTLKCELSARYVCRLLAHMDAHGYRIARPRAEGVGEVRPLMSLASGYVYRARESMPKQGSRAPFRLYQNYVLDQLMLSFGRIDEPTLELTA